MKALIFLSFCASLSFSACCSSLDIAILPKPQASLDSRNDYKNEVLHRALELTIPEYGTYQVRLDGPSMKRKRALAAIQEGKLINIYFSPESQIWRENTLEIPIPIRRGLLNYRLLLIHEDNLALFKNIHTIEQLQALKMGLQYDWSTKDYLADYPFITVTGTSYEGLFVMLENKRFDYIPRGVNEIFNELRQRQANKTRLTIEPHLAIYIPTPTYTYVSAKYPRLAKRVKTGLEMMVKNGDLKRLFHIHFEDEIKQANLTHRTILFLDPAHKLEMEKSPEIWYNPFRKD